MAVYCTHGGTEAVKNDINCRKCGKLLPDQEAKLKLEKQIQAEKERQSRIDNLVIPKWEYRVIQYGLNRDGQYQLIFRAKTYIGVENITEFINTLGEDGWEMVTSIPEIGNYIPSSQVASHIAGVLFSPIGPAHTTHHTTTVGHSIWFKRMKR